MGSFFHSGNGQKALRRCGPICKMRQHLIPVGQMGGVICMVSLDARMQTVFHQCQTFSSNHWCRQGMFFENCCLSNHLCNFSVNCGQGTLIQVIPWLHLHPCDQVGVLDSQFNTIICSCIGSSCQLQRSSAAPFLQLGKT